MSIDVYKNDETIDVVAVVSMEEMNELQEQDSFIYAKLRQTTSVTTDHGITTTDHGITTTDHCMTYARPLHDIRQKMTDDSGRRQTTLKQLQTTV